MVRLFVIEPCGQNEESGDQLIIRTELMLNASAEGSPERSEETRSIPLHGRWYFHLTNPGELLEVDAIIVPAIEWQSLPQSLDPMWRPINFGVLTVALRSIC